MGYFDSHCWHLFDMVYSINKEVKKMEIEIGQKFWCKCGNEYYPHKGIRNKSKHGKGNLYKYYPKEIKFCCEEMKKAFDKKFIGFGEFEDGGYCGFGRANTNINIYSCSPYPEGAFWTEMKINFCPFCGKKIIERG
jgi:hypothetical protein